MARIAAAAPVPGDAVSFGLPTHRLDGNHRFQCSCFRLYGCYITHIFPWILLCLIPWRRLESLGAAELEERGCGHYQ